MRKAFKSLMYATLAQMMLLSGNVPIFSVNVSAAAIDKPVTIYNSDFDSYSSFEIGSAFRISPSDTKSKTVIASPGEHHFRFVGGSTDDEFHYADLMLDGVNAGDFGGNTVFQADYRIGANNTQNIQISLRDVKAYSETPIYITKDGYIYRNDTDTPISNISCKNSWVNVALALHYDTVPATFDVYLNGSLAAENISFVSSSVTSDIYFIRYHYPVNDTDGSILDIDNLWIYHSKVYHDPDTLEGVGGEYLTEKEPWTHEIDTSSINPDLTAFSAVEETPVVHPTARLTDYSEAKAAYSGAICFAEGTYNLWIKDKKYKSDYVTRWDNEKLLVAAPVLAALMNTGCSVTETTAQIGNITATAGNSYITVNNSRINTAVSVQTFDGTIYIPLEEFAIYGMKKWYGSSFLGFGVIANDERDIHYETDSNRPNLYTVGNTSHMMAYLILDLPNAVSLAAINNAQVPTKRPYLTETKSNLERLKALTETDITAKQYSDAVIENANAILSKTYTLNDTQASEKKQPSPVFSSTEPWTLYWAYYMTGDSRYVQKAEEMALMTSSLSHWSSSFHFLQTAQGLIGASAFYDLFYNEFSSETKNALANAIINNGLIPANEYYEGSKVEIHHDWSTRCTNWNAVPNSGIIVAASTLLGENYDDELMTKSLERAFVSLGYFMQYFAPDGGGPEGIGYTSFTLSYLCPAIDVLERKFGTDFGITDYPGFEEVAYFIPDATSSNYHYSLNDDSVEGLTPPNICFWFANRYNDGALADYALSYYENHGANKAAYSASILQNYIPADTPYESLMSLDAIYNGTELAFSRDNFSDASTFLGVHGGYNHVAHGRYDYGTFRFDAFGMRFATATGCDSYSLQSIGNFAHNSKYYVIRPEAHNVYVVNPDEDAGQNRYTYGRINVKEQKEKGIIYTLDMLPAYSADVKAAQRGFMLTNDRKVLVIQDEIVPFEGSTDEIYWFWHTYADIDIDNENNIITLTRENKKVKLYFDCNVDISLSYGDVAPLPSSPNPEGQLQNTELTSMKKITAKFTANGSPVTFRVIAEPMGQEYSRGELTPISSWTIPDGSTDDEYYSKADSITADGVIIPNFDPDCYDYTVYYSTETGLPPVIAAQSKNAEVTVTQATAHGDTAVVKVKNNSHPDNYKIYTITLLSRDVELGTVNTYVDCDFTDHPPLTDANGTVGNYFYIYHTRGGSPSFEADAQRSSRVLRYKLASADASGAVYDSTALVHLDHNLAIEDTTTPGGLVTEFSFKVDKYAKMAVGAVSKTVLETDREGNIYAVFGNEGKRHIGTYRPGEWYNVKIMYDNVYKYLGLHTRVFIYINDNKYAHMTDTFQSDTWNATHLDSMPGFSTKKLRFSLCANQSKDVNFYLDDIKLYMTEGGPYGKADIDSDLVGTKISPDNFAVTKNALNNRNEIYVPETATLSDLYADISESTNSRLVFCKSGEVISPEQYSSVSAASATLYVVGETGKLLMPYDIVLEDNAMCIEWQLLKGENKTAVSSINELASKDELYISAKINSTFDTDKNGTLTLAVYDEDKLLGVKSTPVCALADTITEACSQEALKLPESFTELTVKAFIWEHSASLNPLSLNYTLK